MGTDLRVHGGGEGEPLLLLLHGLGATGEFWAGWPGLLSRHWPGRWLAPDLPGHGGSPPLPEYTFDALATALLPLLTPQDRPVALGHSLGGVVALALALRRMTSPPLAARRSCTNVHPRADLAALSTPPREESCKVSPTP